MQKITFQDYPNTTTPLNASNMNDLQDNVENAISSSETTLKGLINDKIKYSTTETEIGTWIDNKKIYRKVINTGQISSTTKSVAHNISNLSFVINMFGVAIEAGVYYTLPRISNSNTDRQIAVKCDTTNVYLEAGTNANFSDSYVVIEYTKSS